MSSISPAQQSGWAGQLLDAVGDTTTSSGAVVLWLRGNLGILNSYLTTDFSVSGDVSGDDYIVPEFNSIQSGIYNELYICNWLRKKARTTLGSMDFDWTEMEGQDQGKIKKVSYAEKAKSYQLMSKDCDALIKELIKTYRGGNFAHPQQITFNGRESSRYINFDLFNWSSINPICGI